MRENLKEKANSASFQRSKRVTEANSIRKKKRDGLLASKRIKETSEESLLDHSVGQTIGTLLAWVIRIVISTHLI
jgi:hypothetical protein